MNPVNGSSSRNNTNVKANTSLLLGIVSVVFVVFVTLYGVAFAVVGIVFGLIGLKEIRHTGQPGRGRVIAGLICSTVAIVIPLAIFFLYYGVKIV